ncbi:MAG: gamma-glutamyl-gamma-aminobutyrate hydrolase family protein [Candidatus Eremiobacterota bacterium]
MYKLIILFIFCFLIFYKSLPASAGEVKIGLIYSREKGVKLQEGEDKLQNYRKAIEMSGGTIVVLSEAYDEEFLTTQLNQLHGLLIPGGGDIDPKFFNEENKGSREPDAALDAFEFDIIKYCVERNIPVLAICRGHQLINVYFGGNLYQDLPSQYERHDLLVHQILDGDKIKPCFHYINIQKNSLLYEILREERIRSNSSHHQSVKNIAPGFKITSLSEDGVIEAMEGTGDEYIMSVQFHP